jgi:hypothetical protein
LEFHIYFTYIDDARSNTNPIRNYARGYTTESLLLLKNKTKVAYRADKLI